MNCQQYAKFHAKRLNESKILLKVLRGLLYFVALQNRLTSSKSMIAVDVLVVVRFVLHSC